MCIFHKWNPWGACWPTDFNRALVQFRACAECKRVQVRIIQADRMLNHRNANEVLS